MLNKNLLKSCIVLCWLLIFSWNARAEENYYIDNKRVLLYKIINFWYDCLEEESQLLCQSPIRCKSKGRTQVRYDSVDKALTLEIRDGFAGLLSIFNPPDSCSGPSAFVCTFLNPKYFGSGGSVVHQDKSLGIRQIEFLKINSNQATQIRAMATDITGVLEGRIGGLMNGRIALHPCGDFIKGCQAQAQNQYPITLQLFNSITNETLATYSINPKH
ncbi:MAG: hypothetical protein GY729_22255 [Desulfobacteraceae bacterium]|nr:hypothetical protein [Desulfobacteraceae bacterium]